MDVWWVGTGGAWDRGLGQGSGPCPSYGTQ